MNHPDSSPRPPPTRHATGRSFTLIELMVVISIIAVLASLLLPALQRARTMVKRTTCMSSQRQFGIAITYYLGDFNDYYPSNIYYDDNTKVWQGLLESLNYVPMLYRKTTVTNVWEPTGELYCPITHERFVRWVVEGGRAGRQFMQNGKACTTEKVYFSYAFPTNNDDRYNPNNTNLSLGGRMVKASAGLPAVPNVSNSYISSPPSNTVLLFDNINVYPTSVVKFSFNHQDIGTTNWFNKVETFMIHDLNANFLWVDGHAAPEQANIVKYQFDRYATLKDDSFCHFQLGR